MRGFTISFNIAWYSVLGIKEVIELKEFWRVTGK